MYKYCGACRAKNGSGRRLCNYCQRVKSKFGIDPKGILTLRRECADACMICGGRDLDRRLAIDHDHESGHVRGLLCTSCNIGLGCLPTMKHLEAAMEYLAKGPALYREYEPSQRLKCTAEIADVLQRTTPASLRGKARLLAEMTGLNPDAAMSQLRRASAKHPPVEESEIPLDNPY